MTSSECSEDLEAQRDPNDNSQFRKEENDVSAVSKQYGRKCEKQRANKDLSIAVNFLKKNDLLAVPFNKGCGFYVMEKSSYQEKLDKMLLAYQFQPVPSNDRKNAKDICVKEEDRINSSLLELMKSGAISDTFYQQCRSVDGQPARLYGQVKVH